MTVTPTRATRVRALLCTAPLLLLLPLAASPAASQTPHAHFSTSTPAQPESALREAIVAFARNQLGERYRLGGQRPGEGFDCSGLIHYIMSAFDLSLPRTAALQALVGREVTRDPERLRPGDLLTFGHGKRVTHVGIYVGNGRYIHASSVAGRVIESPLDRPPHPRIRPWQGVRRLLVSDTTRSTSG